VKYEVGDREPLSGLVVEDQTQSEHVAVRLDATRHVLDNEQ